MAHLLDNFFKQIRCVFTLLILTGIFFCLSNSASAQNQSGSKKARTTKKPSRSKQIRTAQRRPPGFKEARTAETVGTITKIYKTERSRHHYYSPGVPTQADMNSYAYTIIGLVLAEAISDNSNFVYLVLTPSQYMSKNYDYTEISYLGTTITYGFAVDPSIYKVGDKLIMKYSPHNIQNAVPVLERPCFEKGELADTTEGIVHSVTETSCSVTYKVYNSSDSMQLSIVSRGRYLSQRMLDTLHIKENYIYKIIYNRQTKRMEVLFNSIVDSTHQDKNKHTYTLLDHIANGNPVEAMRALNECIQLDSQNAFYYYQLGKAKENMREYKDAVTCFTKYIELRPTDSRGYQWRAAAYIVLSDFDAAKKDATQLLELNYLDEEAYYLMGQTYYYNKEYEKAIDSYSAAIYYTIEENPYRYYYNRARAKEKLYGKKSDAAESDYEKAKLLKQNKKNSDVPNTNVEDLQENKHDVYITLTSDNTLAFNNHAYQSNMQGQITVPYFFNTGGSVPMTFDKTFSINHSNHKNSFTLGLFSLEVGAYRRLYGRVEIGIVLNNGGGPPAKIRSVLGYNIKLIDNNRMILRPELGLTYFNRSIYLGAIDFDGRTGVSIMGTNFKYHTDRYSYTDKIKVNFCENVWSFSPSLSLWLWPYSSKLVVRVGVGYNFVFAQKYSVYFQSNKNHLRKDLDNLNMQFSNANGSSTQFFSYNGLFVNFGIGIRF